MSSQVKAKIYKIVDNTNGDIYIGSTCKSLNCRLSGHVSSYKRYKLKKSNYTTSFKIIANGDYRIELIENVNYDVIYERESYHIKNNKCVNIAIPCNNIRQQLMLEQLQTTELIKKLNRYV